MIEVKNVSKSFGKRDVLSGVSLTIDKGSVWGLVGINGAGKSTLLRLISGVLEPDKGEIWVDEESVFDNPSTKKKIFFLSDDPYYSTLTGDEQAKFYSAFYPFDYNIYEEYKDKFSLSGLKPIIPSENLSLRRLRSPKTENFFAVDKGGKQGGGQG